MLQVGSEDKLRQIQPLETVLQQIDFVHTWETGQQAQLADIEEKQEQRSLCRHDNT